MSGVFSLLFLVYIALILIDVARGLASFSSEGSGGLAAVSAGVSEWIVELGLLSLVSFAVVWLWGRFADRRS